MTKKIEDITSLDDFLTATNTSILYNTITSVIFLIVIIYYLKYCILLITIAGIALLTSSDLTIDFVLSQIKQIYKPTLDHYKSIAVGSFYYIKRIIITTKNKIFDNPTLIYIKFLTVLTLLCIVSFNYSINPQLCICNYFAPCIILVVIHIFCVIII